ncbi:hypothetical protein DFV33_04705 [Salmonella enterica subsp. enterica serovar Bareilly]|nr:hypothetical protein [Salmonella enterica subsp. enterica serovar Typhimurium]EEE9654037.1 hypothetical protein [Salmonella enterica subsp. enterica serovar Bareilly]
MRLIDLTGKTFGRLTVLNRDTTWKGTRVKWVCLCTCGKRTSVAGSNLLKGTTSSCGCLAKELLVERSTTHGLSRSPEYGVWNAMINRCCNSNSANFGNYGGRGISVCERWKSSFENFIADMGRRPSNKHSIERVNNNGNYEPGNCIWATTTEQLSNKRNNYKGMFHGKEITLAELSRNTEISVNVLRKRIIRDGLTFEEAVLLGDGVQRYMKDGLNLSIKEWSEKLNIPYKVLHNRLRIRRWPIEKALDNAHWK